MATESAPTWATGIAAITLFAEDLPAMKAFYQSTFDLPVVFEDPNSVVFKIGPTLINILEIAEAPSLIAPVKVANREDGARYQYTIHVDHVDATCEDLARRGVSLTNGPMNRPWGSRTAMFADPAGHLWEIAGPPKDDA